MRRWIAGRFLYLDADTLVVRRLNKLWENSESVLSAALDRNYRNPGPHFPSWVVPLYESLGWRCPLQEYFNTGVLVVSDEPSVHEFFEEWHARWNCTVKQGCVLDQPAFNSAVASTSIRLTQLSTRYNGMVDADPQLARRANVLHFFTNQGQPTSGTLLWHLINAAVGNGDIDWNQVDECVRQGHPWAKPYQPWLMVRSGNYFRAAFLKAKKCLV